MASNDNHDVLMGQFLGAVESLRSDMREDIKSVHEDISDLGNKVESLIGQVAATNSEVNSLLREHADTQQVERWSLTLKNVWASANRFAWIPMLYYLYYLATHIRFH